LQAKQHVLARRRDRLAALTTCRARDTRFAVAQDARSDDPGLTTTRNPGIGLLDLATDGPLPERSRKMQIGVGHSAFHVEFGAIFVDNLRNLKQYAMLFEQVHIIGLKEYLKAIGDTPGPRLGLGAIPDIRYLEDRGFLNDAALTSEESIFRMTEEQLDEFEFIRANSDLKKAIIEVGNEWAEFLNPGPDPEFPYPKYPWGIYPYEKYVNETAPNYHAHMSRIHALILRNQFGINAISMDHFWERGSRSIDRGATETALYEIIINGWPMPADIIPWDDIFAFRSEATTQQQLRALRLWVADMAKGKLTIAEASERIEYLKQGYRSHMKGASIQMGTSVLRTFVVGAAGLIENVIKLKLKELAESPFKLWDARATLVDAERKATGRELAYVVQAEDKLRG
jgi:hypothetical protein